MLETNIQSALENAKKQMKRACEISSECRIDMNEFEIISSPKRIIEVNIPVRMDSWKIKTYTGFRSQHNDSRWPFKWWIRFHQNVSRDEVKALSMWMSLKCAVIDIPLWGWKWWIIVNPKELSEGELERLSRWYVREIYKYIGPGQDIPAPDVNTNPKIMWWMMDEYSRLVWKYSPGSFTWKPLTIWWSKWRAKATAQWWLYVLEKILELNETELKWKKLIIQWAWNAWLTFAELVLEKWVKLVWISDSKWWIYNEKWLDLDKIKELKRYRKSVIEYTDAEQVWGKDILQYKTDILVPAALENQIDKSNADNIKAKIILELANGPITPEADDILVKKDVVIIPDILANAGWVMVSYFEQVQNDMNFYWEEEEVEKRLSDKITLSAENVYNMSKKYNSSLRSWAFIIAMDRIFNAMRDRWEV